MHILGGWVGGLPIADLKYEPWCDRRMGVYFYCDNKNKLKL